MNWAPNSTCADSTMKCWAAALCRSTFFRRASMNGWANKKRKRLQAELSTPSRRQLTRGSAPAIIGSNAPVFSHAASDSRADDGGAHFGADGHAAGHPRARSHDPQIGGHESVRSEERRVGKAWRSVSPPD